MHHDTNTRPQMTEIEKMKRYIERSKNFPMGTPYQMNLLEAFVLADMSAASVPPSNGHGFVVVVSDNSCIHLGIFEGDKLICDYLTSPARFVIGVWDDLSHICTDIGGHLFDEAARTNAPSDAMILGRVVAISRPLIVPQEANPYG